MSAWTIFLAVTLKGVVFTFLQWKGWLPDYTDRARRADEERLVLRAYREWRKNPGSRPPPDFPRRVLARGPHSLPGD